MEIYTAVLILPYLLIHRNREALLCRDCVGLGNGVALTRSRIMDAVWETSWLGSTKTLDTHVLALRQKLGAEAITTLRGVGYRFDLP